MTTNQLETETAAWLANLYEVHSWPGVVHEVAAVISEGSNYSRAHLRYRTTLAAVMNSLNVLYDESGNEKLLDMAHDIRRLIEWSDNGMMPRQLNLFDMSLLEQEGQS